MSTAYLDTNFPNKASKGLSSWSVMRSRGSKRGLSFLMDQSVTSTNKPFRLGLSRV